MFSLQSVLADDAVGIGDEDFNTLQVMVDAAEDYGAKASLNLPPKSARTLGKFLESFATSITSTQAEMTCMATFNQQNVEEVYRESKTKASIEITSVSDQNFYIYNKHEVERNIHRKVRHV